MSDLPDGVVSCSRMWEQLSGDESENGEAFSVGYLVRLAAPSNMGPRLARAAIGYARGATFAEAFPESFPEEGDPDTSGMVCQSINATVRANAPEYVDVSVKFAVPRNASGTGGGVINPLTRPAVPEWAIEEEMVPAQKLPAESGGVREFIVNSAGEPFDPPPMMPVGRPVMRVRKNIAKATFTASWLLGIVNKVNSDVFYGATAGQARIRGASASLTIEDGIEYWQVQAEIAFLKEGWNGKKFRDQGRRQISDAEGDESDFFIKYEAIRGQDGMAVTDPVDLDGAGKALPDASDPVYIGPFDLYESTAFGPLGFSA